MKNINYSYIARYIRALLSNFLCSASRVVSPLGEIHVALCDGHGGSYAPSIHEWKQSWMATSYASEHNLLLLDVSPLEEVRVERHAMFILNLFIH